MYLLFNNRIQHPLFEAPDDKGGGHTILEESQMTADDMADFLLDDGDEQETIDIGVDKDKTPPKAKETTKETTKKDDKKDLKTSDEHTDDEEIAEDEDEIDELAEIEAELEEPDDDELELVTPVRRREILAKYPQLFKDFPYLEKAYYREQQYTEIFPTLDDARTAVSKSETLDNFEQDVMGGDISTILKTVKDTNANAFYKIVDMYMSTLSQVDEKAYFHVLGNIGRMTIASMVQEARRSQNEDLEKAALILNRYMFGNSDFQPPTRLSREERPQDDTREKQISERERQFVTQQFESTREDLNSRVNNALMNTINNHIDPRDSMPPYVKKNAARDAMDTLGRLIAQDGRFRALTDKLWERAFQDNFSRESVNRIRSAYAAKAKTLLPAVIKKARIEALRGIGRRVKDDTTQDTKKGPVPGRRAISQDSKGKIKDAKEIPRGMSTLEFLNQE